MGHCKMGLRSAGRQKESCNLTEFNGSAGPVCRWPASLRQSPQRRRRHGNLPASLMASLQDRTKPGSRERARVRLASRAAQKPPGSRVLATAPGHPQRGGSAFHLLFKVETLGRSNRPVHGSFPFTHTRGHQRVSALKKLWGTPRVGQHPARVLPTAGMAALLPLEMLMSLRVKARSQRSLNMSSLDNCQLAFSHCPLDVMIRCLHVRGMDSFKMLHEYSRRWCIPVLINELHHQEANFMLPVAKTVLFGYWESPCRKPGTVRHSHMGQAQMSVLLIAAAAMVAVEEEGGDEGGGGGVWEGEGWRGAGGWQIFHLEANAGRGSCGFSREPPGSAPPRLASPHIQEAHPHSLIHYSSGRTISSHNTQLPRVCPKDPPPR
ncbi:hypothetical protein P4O66_013470 [Electrophorus voltai]|uniref:Uncharacterized protein n=1 Tax=Electrophorus voltai TaxID=2609070 RepID=A0AAD8Z2V9_9TELE|nr:hypothetical protein P4O66_013470 [Electrophorus voltai]